MLCSQHFSPVCVELFPSPASAYTPALSLGGTLAHQGALPPTLPVRISNRTKRAKEICHLWNNAILRVHGDHRNRVVFVVWNVIPILRLCVILSMQKFACG